MGENTVIAEGVYWCLKYYDNELMTTVFIHLSVWITEIRGGDVMVLGYTSLKLRMNMNVFHVLKKSELQKCPRYLIMF